MKYYSKSCTNQLLLGAIPLLLVVLGLGCSNQRHLVIAATGTSIGVEISENPATQVPQAKLGYQRTELAMVPTNRSSTESTSVDSLNGGAKDVANVLMELRYGGIFDMGATSGIYQRLAVGEKAVTQPGASLMFAKDAGGAVNSETEKALKAVQAIPADDRNSGPSMNCLRKHRKDSAKATAIDAAIVKSTKSSKTPNGLAWDDLVDDPNPTVVKAVLEEVAKSGITCP